MAIPDVQDILAVLRGWTPDFAPLYGDETSGQANGMIRQKRLRPPLWRMSFQSAPTDIDEHRLWQARLLSLQNGRKLFYGYDLGAIWPRAYPGGAWPTGDSFDGISAKVKALDGGRTQISLKSLPAGYVVSVGDHLSITWGTAGNLALVAVMETVTADGDGETASFVIEPYLPAGVAADDVVAVKRPACHMAIVPGSISTPVDTTNRTGTVSFEAIQVP